MWQGGETFDRCMCVWYVKQHASCELLPVISCYYISLPSPASLGRRGEAKPKTFASKFSVRNEMLERIAARGSSRGRGTWATDWGMCQHLFLLSDLGKTFYPAPPPEEPPPLPHSDSAVSRCFDAWHSCLALWLDNTLDMGTEKGRGPTRCGVI